MKATVVILITISITSTFASLPLTPTRNAVNLAVIADDKSVQITPEVKSNINGVESYRVLPIIVGKDGVHISGTNIDRNSMVDLTNAGDIVLGQDGATIIGDSSNTGAGAVANNIGTMTFKKDRVNITGDLTDKVGDVAGDESTADLTATKTGVSLVGDMENTAGQAALGVYGTVAGARDGVIVAPVVRGGTDTAQAVIEPIVSAP